MSPQIFKYSYLYIVLLFIIQVKGQCDIILSINQTQTSLDLIGAAKSPVQAQIIYTDDQPVAFTGTITLRLTPSPPECPPSLPQIKNNLQGQGQGQGQGQAQGQGQGSVKAKFFTDEPIIISPQTIGTKVAIDAASPALSINQFINLTANIESEEFFWGEGGEFQGVVANFSWATGSVAASSVFLQDGPLEQPIAGEDYLPSQFLISGGILGEQLVWEDLSIVLPFEQGVSGIDVTGEIEFIGNISFQGDQENADITSQNTDVGQQELIANNATLQNEDQIYELNANNLDTTQILQNTQQSQEECYPRQKSNLCGLCECEEGWEGYGCSKCRSTSACLSWLGIDPTEDEDAIGVRCGSDFMYGPGTQMKAYKCELDGQQGNLLAPGSLAFTCLTTQDPYQLATLRPELRYGTNDPLFVPLNNSEISEGGACTVTFALRQFPDSPLTCFASGCKFQSNSANIQCPVTQCECPESGCPVQELRAITETIQNSVFMECDRQSGLCDISLDDLSGLKLRGRCEVGECIVPTAALVVGDDGFQEDDDKWKQVLIVASPLMLIFAVFALLLISIIIDPKFYKIKKNNVIYGPIGEGTKNESNQNQSPNSCTNPRPFLNLKAGVKDLELWFNNVTCTLPGKKKTILDNVSGFASSGEILAILGPSGSGKTTLLNILANSSWDIAAQSIIKSDIQLLLKSSNKSVSGNACNKLMAFVPQEDSLLPALTVEETLRYAAILKLPFEKLTSQIVNESISKVVTDLGLQKICKTKVGGGGLRGISGGEKRRVSIAMELLTSPQILLLDEPTSGLDSFSAGNLINLLKSMAVENDRIVAASLHQPSAEIFARLDKVLLLAQGKCAYYGKVFDVEEFLGNVGLPCTQQAFIAEHLLTIVQDQQNVNRMFDVSRDGMEGYRKAIGNGYQEIESTKESANNLFNQVCQFYKQTKVLFWRSLLEIWRNPQFLLMHVLLGIIMGGLVGLIFYQVEDDTAGAQNRAGAFFFTLAMFAYTSITTVDLLMSERRLVFREVRAGYYKLLPYMVSKITLDNLCLRVLPCILFTSLFYPMMGLKSGAIHISTFITVLSLFTCVTGNIAIIIVALTRTPGMVVLIINALFLIFLLVAGFLVATPSIPGIIRWCHYISVFSYAFEIFMINEVAGLDLILTLEGIGSVVSDGEAFISTLGLSVGDFDRDIWVMVVFYFVSALLAWFSTLLALQIKPIYMRIRNQFQRST